ncbi:kinesin-like protein KIF12 isoform X1 [Plodia interpunctella]|uniref:kinesin-like protein KIF12 isoform X1 n=1 Tax=Plodia interpunctella TaxID=58824 RepID=UPI002367B923|nr:kinesin-like protein KIF12 isoform X1 [Plodia interpunctella]XP_053609399.1 kinesin-like protein KIF12 isoform X1 [Plodia interpunctella]XP_053609400.1 kinesin-like protein KIF12 isoform X1 [Plodia interpunctella]
MALKNLQLFHSKTDMLYRHGTPMRAPPSALSRSISKSAETLVATTRNGKEIRARKARSTEQPGGSLVKGASSSGLPALVKGWGRDDDSVHSRSRNGSGSSRAGSVDRSTRGSSTTLNSDEDNINVVVRIRPFNDRERAVGEREILEFPGRGQVVCNTEAPGQKAKVFSYNVVFEPAATQEDVLEYSGIKRLLEMAIEGFSCTAFCYGQTGSGKTHTLTGPPGLVERGTSPHNPEHGLVVRSFVYLFKLIRERPECHFILKASFLEIYNEKVIDLLNPGTARKPLQVRWSKESRSFYVENLFTVDCEELDDLFAVLEEGMRNRAVGAHAMNAHSSRSHTLLCVRIRKDLKNTGDVTCSTHGKINFVDLAGSEMTKKTNSSGKTLEEANNINRSLMVLGYCIAQLSDGKKRGHIPYRDSKLTKLLADSLAGNGVTLMIACIAPSKSNLSETINTLRYASRAKKIKSKPIVKMDARDALILSLKREVEALQAENQHLRTALHVQTDYNMDTYSQRRTPTRVEPNKLYQLPQTELVELVQLHMDENSALRTENTELFGVRDQLLRDQELLSRENERLLKKLEDVNSVCIRSPIIPARPAYTDEANIWTNPSASTPSNGS